MSIKIDELLKNLTESASPSGYEFEISQSIKKVWQNLVDSLEEDQVGNLIGIKQGSGGAQRRKILLAAHMDEIGLMVKQIVAFPDQESGNGFLKFTLVGGVDLRHLFGQTVLVHGSGPDGRSLVGIIGALPTQMLPNANQSETYDYDDLVIDVGLPYQQLGASVAVGDFISFRQPLRKLLNKRVTGKALDNRASVAAVTVCLEQLQERQHDWDIIAVATAQEETRLLGAFASAFRLEPDLAIAMDVTFGLGPGTKEGEAFEIGGGPTLGFGPNIYPGIYEKLKETASKIEMKVHTEPASYPGGTDAFALQIARQGIPTGLVSIPLRYMHTMVETVALVDIKRSGRLLAEFISGLKENFLEDVAKNMIERE
jgi:putative aminopeptidase FrvX